MLCTEIEENIRNKCKVIVIALQHSKITTIRNAFATIHD